MEELQQMDQRTKKKIIMTMQKALHRKDNIDRLDESKKKKGRRKRFDSIEDSVNVSIQ